MRLGLVTSCAPSIPSPCAKASMAWKQHERRGGQPRIVVTTEAEPLDIMQICALDALSRTWWAGQRLGDIPVAGSGAGWRRFSMTRSSGWARLRMARARSSSMSGSRLSGRSSATSRSSRCAPLAARQARRQAPLCGARVGARLQAVIADLEVIGEIAAGAAGEQRKDESREPHVFPPQAG